jgi:two-component system cell cycle sensor histidine kinase/response regulator CckA
LERFEAIGRLAGGIAHDFNNVIGTVIGLAQLGYEEASANDPLRVRFRKIGDQAQRGAALTAQLLAFARRQVLQPRCLSLNDSITELTGFLQTAIGDQIEFKSVLAPKLDVIRADPTQVDQILMNLCLNARDAMPDGGRLVVETRNVELNDDFCRVHSYGMPGNYVQLLISDTGTGMDAATLQRMFEPFFTTKELGRGTGLGLATVYGLVKQPEGFINVYSELGQGTTFHLYFPASVGTPEGRAPISVVPVSRGTETILVADDHEGLREIASEVLSSQGYTVISAKNGEEAVRLFKENQENIRLVVLDVAMPLLTGPEAYVQIRALKPGFPVMFTTGYTSESASLKSHLETGAIFLQKPYSPQELGRMVRGTLDRKTGAPS